MFMAIKKNLSLILLSAILLTQAPSTLAQDAGSKQDGSIVDDSVRDISVVLGAGAVGAILGLSTLSFVETPSDHLKNISIGGAVGIIIGVGVVIFSQATRNSVGAGLTHEEIPMNPDKFANLTRVEFSSDKIAKNYLKVPNVGFNFSF
jgi:hypothetical protein